MAKKPKPTPGQLSLFDTSPYEKALSYSNYDIEDGYEDADDWPPIAVTESSWPPDIASDPVTESTYLASPDQANDSVTDSVTDGKATETKTPPSLADDFLKPQLKGHTNSTDYYQIWCIFSSFWR